MVVNSVRMPNDSVTLKLEVRRDDDTFAARMSGALEDLCGALEIIRQNLNGDIYYFPIDVRVSLDGGYAPRPERLEAMLEDFPLLWNDQFFPGNAYNILFWANVARFPELHTTADVWLDGALALISEYDPKCSIPDDHIDPRRSALFMARLLLREVREGVRAC
jgi:hypothetical protein